MRKYILTIVLIGIGLALLIYSYTKNNQPKYSETLFSNEAKKFEKNFTDFIQGVEEDLISIKSNLNDTNKIKDTTYSKNYFLGFMENNPYVLSTILIRDAYKIGIRRDKKSFIYAIDSTRQFEMVRWQRFVDKKVISSWQESFDQSIDRTILLQRFKNKKNQIQWIFKTNEVLKEGNNQEYFYAGFSYPSGDESVVLLLEFSNKTLLEHFKLKTKYQQVNLLIESGQNKIVNLALGNKNSDSLQIATLNHFKKFDQKESGIFSFSYKDLVYWNSYKYFPSKTGIIYYLLTIPNTEILESEAKNYSKWAFWLAIMFIIGGLISIIIKKRFFYIPNKILILPVKEILVKDEDRYLEFKSSARWDYRQEKTNPELEKIILKTLAAFGNTDGGILLIGVDDDKNIIGLENDFNTLKKSTADYYEIHLRNLFHNAMGVKYVTKYVRMQFENCENKKIVCKIKILATNEPIYLKFKNKNGQIEEKFFVRSGNSSQEIKSIAEINDYINTRFEK
ncbi:MAG: ATP-binding protein [Flavobacteriaceae bacterium]|nr:ATP-binding protein [Flavobacteriaceae bacterium]